MRHDTYLYSKKGLQIFNSKVHMMMGLSKLRAHFRGVFWDWGTTEGMLNATYRWLPDLPQVTLIKLISQK